MNYYDKHIFICTNQKIEGKVCCANAGADEIFNYMKQQVEALKKKGLEKVRVSKSGCLGRCKQGPCMVVYPEGIWYTYHSFEDIDEILHSHFLEGRVLHRLLIQ